VKIAIKKAYLDNMLKRVSLSPGGLLGSINALVMGVKDGLFYLHRADKSVEVLVQTDLFKAVGADEKLRIVVSLDRLTQLVKFLSSKNIAFVLEPGKTKIVISDGEGYEAEWSLVSGEGIPGLPSLEGKGGDETRISVEAFLSAVNCVNYAASRDGVRMDLMQIVFKDKKCWATDFFRYQETVIDSPISMVLPVAALDVLKFIGLSGVQELTIREDDDFYYFITGSDLFMCRKSKVSPISPKEVFFSKMSEVGSRTRFSVERMYLMDVIKRISITSERGSSKIRFKLDDKKMKLSGADDFGNKGVETLNVHVELGEVLEFYTHWEYLLQALQAVKDDTVEMIADKNHVLISTETTLGIVPVLRG